MVREIPVPKLVVPAIRCAPNWHALHRTCSPIKPDELTPAEWALMQTHPIKSAESIRTLSHFKSIVPLVGHHYEDWDGSGT